MELLGGVRLWGEFRGGRRGRWRLSEVVGSAQRTIYDVYGTETVTTGKTDFTIGVRTEVGNTI